MRRKFGIHSVKSPISGELQSKRAEIRLLRVLKSAYYYSKRAEIRLLLQKV